MQYAYQDILLKARKAISDPWTTSDEQKIEIIRMLITLEGPEAVKILSSFLDMIKLPIRVENNIEFPRGGCVSAEAARSLALLRNNTAVKILQSTASNLFKHEYLREAVYYGLGGLSDHESLDILVLGLKDPDALVRRCAVQSLQKSLTQILLYNSKLPSRIIRLLVNYAIRPENMEIEDGTMLARYIVTSNLNEETEDYIAKNIEQEKDENRLLLMADMLRQVKRDSIINVLLAKFYERSHQPEFYRQLGSVLSEHRRPGLKRVAELIAKEKDPLMLIRGLFNPNYKRSFIARRRAALKIIQGH